MGLSLEIKNNDFLIYQNETYNIRNVELWQGGRSSGGAKKLANQTVDIIRQTFTDGIKSDVSEASVIYNDLKCTELNGVDGEVFQTLNIEQAILLREIFVIISDHFYRLIIDKAV